MRCLAPVLLAMTIGPASASDPVGIEWHLLAIDGLPVAAEATLQLSADGQIAGKAPCNSYGAQNGAALPAFAPGPIRATRMACDQLAAEQAFFDALGKMTEARVEGAQNLILTGPEGRTMEFVIDPGDKAIVCLTCQPKD